MPLLQKEYRKLNAAMHMHKEKLKLITTDIFVSLEDDNLPPKNAVARLLELLRANPGVGYATGVNCYRCPQIHKMGMGVTQQIVMDHEKVIKKVSCSPNLTGVHEIVSGGFNCYAVRTKAYADAFKTMEEKGFFPTYIGNDVLITYLIKLNGLKLLADFDLWCDHMQELPDGIYFYNKKDAIQDSYIWSDREKIYKYKAL